MNIYWDYSHITTIRSRLPLIQLFINFHEIGSINSASSIIITASFLCCSKACKYRNNDNRRKIYLVKPLNLLTRNCIMQNLKSHMFQIDPQREPRKLRDIFSSKKNIYHHIKMSGFMGWVDLLYTPSRYRWHVRNFRYLSMILV